MGRKSRDNRPEHRGSPDREKAAQGTDRCRTAAAACPEPRIRSRMAVLGVCSFLLLAVALVFGRTVQCEMVNFDDDKYVYDNPQVTGGVTAHGIIWALTHSHSSNWHPVTWFSHMMDCQLYGLQPWGHHLGNVLLHAATAILLFLVLMQMTSDLWPSALVAAVFALHPLRVESVAWVAERKDVLSGMFFMLTVAAYVYYARRPFSIARYLAVVVLFAVGLMAKPMLVTLPLVLVLLDYWPLGRWTATSAGHAGGTRPIVEKIPLAALAVASCVVTLLAQAHALASNLVIPLQWRIANALFAYVVYLGQLFWPVGLAAYYPHPIGSLPAWKVACAAIVLLGITAGTLIARRRFPYLVVGWLWYLTMLLPVIGLVQVGDQAMADRYTYLPLIGPCIALAWGAAQACRRWPHRGWVCAITAGLVLMGLMLCAWRQTAYWRDSETLWNRVLACTPENARTHSNLGAALQQRGENDDAMRHFQKALEINPGYLEAQNNLGNALNRSGRFDEAISHYLKALEISPDCAEVHLNLGNALIRTGRFDEAIAHLRMALPSLSGRSELHYNLGNALLQTGRPIEAIDEYRKSLDIRPDYADAINNLGAALGELGRPDEAITHYRKALAIEPRSEDAHNNLGNALAQKGQVAEAIAEYQMALEIRPGFADARNNLGAILADHGRVDEAIVQYRKVLDVSPECAAAYHNLGGALCRQGKLDEALASWREGIRRCPKDSPLLSVTAWQLATSPNASLRSGPEAVALAQRAVELTGGRSPEFLDVLAAAYAEAGRFPDALAIARQALSLASAQNNTALATSLRARIKLYEAGSPLRSKP